VQGNGHIGKDLTVDGTSTLTGDVTTGANVTVGKDLTVNGQANLKDTKIDGTLETTGNATFDADTEVKGNSTVDGNSIVKGDSDVQGNGHIGKDLTVDGTSTLTGDVTTGANVTVGKDLAVKGNSAFTGNVTMNSNASIGKDLTVEGTSTLKGDVFAKSNVTIDKDLTVKGTTNFLGDINIDKDLTIGGSQTVKGDSTIHGSQQIGKDLHVAGTTQLDGNVLMNSNAIVQQNLGVGGNADIKGDLYVHDHNYIDSQGINANGYQIRNVADGAVAPGSHDAVNGGQLYSTKQALTGQINKVGAGAAALAGLHPGEFDPDNKLDFAAGYGHYKDANAAALGVFYHPNEDTTINLSGTMGNGDPMLSAGVTFKLGPSGTKTMSRTALTKQIKEDQKVIKAMADEMAAMKAQMSRVLNLLDMSKKAPFSDVPNGHWAKDAVDTLHGNGALKGYPDGQFHGDKPMTRYEYAQMLYEALQKGAHVDQSTLDEYAPELSQVKANNQK
ncbi:MAG: S-layer homology domain-containing protein, partial [Megasphaera elsdenii]|uniref:S-layer homology domain-containing protein n=1 Tax=Megasphaera elsdenii TaxID=907 RepID=UPI003F00A76D